MAETSLNSVWKCTPAGIAINVATGRINAVHFEGTSMNNTSWLLMAISAPVDRDGPVFIALKDQRIPDENVLQVAADRLQIPIDTLIQ